MTDIKKIARYYFLQGCKQGNKISKEKFDEKAIAANFEVIWQELTKHKIYDNPEQLRDELYKFFAEFMNVEVSLLYTKSRVVPLPEIKMTTAFLTRRVMFERQDVYLTLEKLGEMFETDHSTIIYYLKAVESNTQLYDNFNIANSNIKALYKHYLAHYQK